MLPNASWCFTPEYGPPPSRKHTRFFLFSANWGGWAAHVSTTRHSITYLGSTKWIRQWEKSPTASEQPHLLRKQLPNTVCKVVSKLGVDISDPIPHLNTKDVAKKNAHGSGIPVPGARHIGWKLSVMQPCSLRTCPETSRNMLSFLWNPKSSRTLTNNTYSHSHSETLKLYKLVWVSFGQTERRRSSPVLIWSKFCSKPIFGFPNPGLHTVQSV